MKVLKFILALTILSVSINAVYAGELQIKERLDCSIQAGLEYGIPIDILLAISKTRGGL